MEYGGICFLQSLQLITQRICIHLDVLVLQRKFFEARLRWLSQADMDERWPCEPIDSNPPFPTSKSALQGAVTTLPYTVPAEVPEFTSCSWP